MVTIAAVYRRGLAILAAITYFGKVDLPMERVVNVG